MNTRITLILYGTREARQSAHALLENSPQIRRIDNAGDGHTLRLTLASAVSEGELIGLLSDSGISGFRFR